MLFNDKIVRLVFIKRIPTPWFGLSFLFPSHNLCEINEKLILKKMKINNYIHKTNATNYFIIDNHI